MKRADAWPQHVLLAGLMTIALSFCVQQAWTEYHVSRALDALQSSDRAIDRTREDELSAREALYRSVALARSAATLPAGAGRNAVLDDAAILVESALTRRPHWGAALVAETYLNLLRFGPEDRLTIGAFRDSYRAAPFLRDEADWRIEYALAVWPLMEPEDRRAVAREAILLARGSRNLTAHVQILVGGTPLQPLVSARIWDR